MEDRGHPVLNSIREHNLAEAEKWANLFYEREHRQNRFKEFADKYLKKTQKSYTIKNLDELPFENDFDCFICVTDIIWKRNPHVGFEPVFFLAHDTMKGKKKIAYAACGGPEFYDRWDTRQFLEYISDFDYISVREKGMQRFIKVNAGIDVPCVLDPVFLQEKSFFEELAAPHSFTGGYVLVYLAQSNEPQLVEQAAEFAVEHNLRVIEISDYIENRNKVSPGGGEYFHIYDIGIEEWLGYLINAEYVFTNSFHGCCLSIIMNKQFFTGMRNGLGDKIPNLLDMFGLSWRRLDVGRTAKDLPEIDYYQVNGLRKLYTEQSKQYILGALRNLENREHLPLIPDVTTVTEQVLLRKWTRSELYLVAKRQIKQRIVEPFVKKRVDHLMNKIRYWNQLLYRN